MQCQESKKILDAYVDNEVDVVQSVALEEHLGECPDCAQTLEGRRALKNAVQNANLRYAAPPDLVKQVRRQLRLPEERTAVPKWQWFRSAAWGFAAATAMFAVVAVALVLMYRTSPQDKMAQQVADNFIRSTLMENRGVDVISQDTHTVKPWFISKLSFSPQVVDFEAKGFPLTGGRVDYLDNQAVAALVYKRNQHIVNVFEYPTGSSSSLKSFQERGYNILHWTKGGMEYWVVSDLNQPELRQLAELLGE